MKRFHRTQLLLGEEGLAKLEKCCVGIFGLGGVGSYAAEALARAGIGKLVLIDHDTISLTNINRQLLALESTIGQLKAEVMRERVQEINPQAEVIALADFYSSANRERFFQGSYDYLIDAMDTVSAKLDLIKTAREKVIPLVTSMGTANKLDPSQLQIGDISQTKICPLAKVIRKELGKAGIRKGVKVVYSLEAPLVPRIDEQEPLPEGRRSLPGSVSFVPPVAGMLLASVVINDLLQGIIVQQKRKM